MQIDAPVSHDVWCWAQKLALQRCKKMPGEKWNLIYDVHIFDYAFFCWKISSRELAGRQIGQRGWLVDIRGGQKLHNGAKNFIIIVTSHHRGLLFCFLRSLPTIHSSDQSLDQMHWFEPSFEMFGRDVFEAVEVNGRLRLNFEVATKVWLPTSKKESTSGSKVLIY